MRKRLLLFFFLLLFGTIIATLGSISLPVGDKISNFWPAIIIQALGGLWFGWIGVLAGILFPILSNVFIGGTHVQIFGFIPSNLIQSGLPLLFYRILRRRPQISSLRDFWFFLTFVAILPMFLGGLVGCTAFHLFGDRPFVLNAYLNESYVWGFAHFRTLLILGVPMMIWVAPKVLAAPFIGPYWPENHNKSYAYHSISIKLFLIMSSMTLFPLTLIGMYQLVTLHATDILQPNYMAVAITAAFFSVLIASAILTDTLACPLDGIIDKIENLSETHLLGLDLKPLKEGGDRFANLSRTLDELFERLRAYEHAQVVQQVSAQVAHDIRSPLAALDAALKNTEQLPEKQRIMVRHAVNRIRDIANNLLEKNRQHEGSGTGASGDRERYEVLLLSSLVDPVITEKRVQFGAKQGIDIDFHLTRESYGLFAKVQPVEFRRIVSNLVNNAVEALNDKGKVSISLGHEGSSVVLRVADNGRGIPPEILRKLCQRGETHGKAGGSGLGLYHARTMVEQWGGTLTIDSEPGKGTTVRIKLPKEAAPRDFVHMLELASGRPVLVLDDDIAIHQIWDGRFESSRVKAHDIEIIHFSEPAGLRQWVKNNAEKAGVAVCLLDYEFLGFQETGLSLAEELGLCGRTILVTSRSDEKRVIDECRRLGMRMIPKGLADLVPIKVSGAPIKTAVSKSVAVLIDDDPLVHMNWSQAAGSSGIELKMFSEPGPFLNGLDAYPLDTPIYIDSDLGNGVKGEHVAAQLREKGFTDITLETGHEPAKFAHLPWLKVIGKGSPWQI